MYLGLDVGTSVIKAAIFDRAGRECAEAAERMRLLPAPIGWSELDGEAVWQAGGQGDPRGGGGRGMPAGGDPGRRRPPG